MKKLLSILGSPKFSIVLIILISICALVGSLIPQGDPEAVLNKLSSFFGADANRAHDFLISSGLIDIYSSWYFKALLGLFALNLLACTLKLVPFARKGYSNFDGISLGESITTDKSKEEIIAGLRSRSFNVSCENGIYRAAKHSVGRYGVIILHAGVITVLLGALIGGIFGFKGFMNILEGDSDDVAVLPSGELRQLGFEVRCDDFVAEYYPGTDRPKSYTSDVTIIKDGREATSARIDVNHPLEFEGITFYQTNFGFYPNKNAYLRFRISDGTDSKQFQTKFGELFKLKENYVGKFTDFAPSLAIDDNGSIYSASDKMENPAALLEVYDMDEPVLRAWVLKNKPESGEFGALPELGVSVMFDGLWGVEYTGLSVKKDPGTGIVYAGFALIFLGLIFIYLFNYTAVFFKIEERDGKRAIGYVVKQQRRYPLVSPYKSAIEAFTGSPAVR